MNLKNDVNTLIEMLEGMTTHYFSLAEEERKDYFLQIRAEYNQKENSETSVRNASLFIFLNRTCFNGLYRVNRNNQFNVPFGRYANPKICDRDNLLAVSTQLQKVEILNGDYDATMQYSYSKSFFYFDPPYKPVSETSSFNSYTKDDFNDDEQNRLKAFCDAITEKGSKFMLSNSDPKSVDETNDFFDRLYAEYNIARVDASRRINSKAEKRGVIKELLITNY